MNLIEIGKKYPSSKNISGFIQLYEKYFSSLKNSKINILEIGVEGGDSLRTVSYTHLTLPTILRV